MQNKQQKKRKEKTIRNKIDITVPWYEALLLKTELNKKVHCEVRQITLTEHTPKLSTLVMSYG